MTSFWGMFALALKTVNHQSREVGRNVLCNQKDFSCFRKLNNQHVEQEVSQWELSRLWSFMTLIQKCLTVRKGKIKKVLECIKLLCIWSSLLFSFPQLGKIFPLSRSLEVPLNNNIKMQKYKFCQRSCDNLFGFNQVLTVSAEKWQFQT